MGRGRRKKCGGKEREDDEKGSGRRVSSVEEKLIDEMFTKKSLVRCAIVCSEWTDVIARAT